MTILLIIRLLQTCQSYIIQVLLIFKSVNLTTTSMSLSFTFENQQKQLKQTVTSGIQEHKVKVVMHIFLNRKFIVQFSVGANGIEVLWFYLYV